MAKIVPLFSSSKGNSYYIQGNGSAILVDKFFFQTLMRIRIASLKALRSKIVGKEKCAINATA